MPERRYGLDYVRAVSILYIVGLFHMFEYTGLPDAYRLAPVTDRLAILALGSMTVISGYLCGNRPLNTLADLRSYYWRRFWRIYPPFAVASVLFFLLHLISFGPLIKGLSLVSVLAGGSPRTLWYVDMIVALYAVAPLFQWACRKLWLGLSALAAAMLALFGFFAVLHVADHRILLYMPCFVMGMLFAHKAPSFGWRTGLALLAASLLSIGITFLAPENVLSNALTTLPLTVAGSAFVFCLATMFLDRKKPPMIVAALSFSSYFMYLFHRPVWVVVSGLLHDAAPIVRTATLLLLGVPVVVVLAFQGQTLYDRVVSAFLTKKTRPA